MIINKTFISAIDEKSFCYLALGTGVTHYIKIDRIGVKLVILFLIGCEQLSWNTGMVFYFFTEWHTLIESSFTYPGSYSRFL